MTTSSEHKALTSPAMHFIDGGWRASASGAVMESYDPGLAEPHALFAAGQADDVAIAVAAAGRALRGEWGQTTPAARGRVLYRAAMLLRESVEKFATAEVLDSGKTLAEARGDVNGAARIFEYYAGACDKYEGRVYPLGPAYTSYSIEEPVGVTAHIIPWNYPISTAARSIAPALAAGCTAVVKPAEQTPMTALMLASLLVDAGLPAGVCNVVTGTGREAGAPLVSHPDVRHVTFTGSSITGIGVMQAAAANVASVTLELGGKSPNIVLADADLDVAAANVAGAIFENAGQICSAGSRLVVERSVHAALIEKVVAHADALRMGHGLREGVTLGAVSSAEHQRKIASCVDAACQRGARLVCGGHAVTDPQTGKGWFFEPTILDDLKWNDPAVQEEIFGPVLAVQVVDGWEEAIAAANCTNYALAAGVFTRDLSKAHRIARDVDAGQFYVNQYFAGGIETPFGGNRLSGIGREKGLIALSAYYRTKAVTIKL